MNKETRTFIIGIALFLIGVTSLDELFKNNEINALSVFNYIASCWCIIFGAIKINKTID